MKLERADEVDPDLRSEIENKIYELNVATTGIDDGRELSLALVDDDGARVGALIGWTWGGILEIDLLWVEAPHRRTGHGSTLLRAAEDEGRARGCVRAVLGTHSFQAPGFYAKHGYTEIARLEGYPRGHADIWLTKLL